MKDILVTKKINVYDFNTELTRKKIDEIATSSVPGITSGANRLFQIIAIMVINRVDLSILNEDDNMKTAYFSDIANEIKYIITEQQQTYSDLTDDETLVDLQFVSVDSTNSITFGVTTANDELAFNLLVGG